VRQRDMIEKLYTPEEAAKLLGIAPRTIRNYLRNGVIKGIKTGMMWRVPESDLQAYIDRLKEERDRHYAKPPHKFNLMAKESDV
jgi:excisionase family DNA binding protein